MPVPGQRTVTRFLLTFLPVRRSLLLRWHNQTYKCLSLTHFNAVPFRYNMSEECKTLNGPAITIASDIPPSFDRNAQRDHVVANYFGVLIE